MCTYDFVHLISFNDNICNTTNERENTKKEWGIKTFNCFLAKWQWQPFSASSSLVISIIYTKVGVRTFVHTRFFTGPDVREHIKRPPRTFVHQSNYHPGRSYTSCLTTPNVRSPNKLLSRTFVHMTIRFSKVTINKFYLLSLAILHGFHCNVLESLFPQMDLQKYMFPGWQQIDAHV